MSIPSDGRTPFRHPGGDPKPSRFDDMVAAASKGDWAVFGALRAQYLAAAADGKEKP